MGKKHKHEEHVNHERWVISFADMMTLLFALFVVLYAMGVEDLEKMKKVTKSIAFAFNISGDGKTQDTGIFDNVKGAGEIQVPAPLVTAQDGEMKEFLKDELKEFEEQIGKSLEIVVTDDSVSISAPMSDFFEANKVYPVKASMQRLLERTIDGSLSFTSTIRVRIETPELPIARDPATGKVITSSDLCYQRLRTLGALARINPQVRPSMVSEEFQLQNEQPESRVQWEQQARVILVFSNTQAKNR